MSSTHIYRNPEKYSQNNLLQYNFAMQILENIEIDKKARVLDIGCGDGKITAKIAEMAPEGCVIGTDISNQMIKYASKTYLTQENLGFMQMDARKNKFINQFDLITSFTCLHWINDQQSALHGIARAATANAKVVLFLSHKKSIYHYAQDAIIKSIKWQSYFKNYIDPRSFFEIEVYKDMLRKSGLNIITINEQEMIYHFDTCNDLIGFASSSMAIVKQIPEVKKQAFLEDFCEEFFKQSDIHKNPDFIPLSFWCLIVKAVK